MENVAHAHNLSMKEIMRIPELLSQTLPNGYFNFREIRDIPNFSLGCKSLTTLGYQCSYMFPRNSDLKFMGKSKSNHSDNGNFKHFEYYNTEIILKKPEIA